MSISVAPSLLPEISPHASKAAFNSHSQWRSYLCLYEYDNPIPQIKVKLPTICGWGRLGTMDVFHGLKRLKDAACFLY